MSLVGIAISAYKKSPFYPSWGRSLSKMLSTLNKVCGVPLIQCKSLPYGITMNIDSEQFIDTKILHDRFEPLSIKLIDRVVQPGWICCDVGANIGFLSLLMAKKTGPEGRVYSFEPSEWTFERLKANIEANSYHWIEPHRQAVGAESKPSVELRVPCGYRLDGKDTSTVQQMPLVALDDFFANAERLDFIKIDTDGYEPYVLTGARRTIERLHPMIFFELGPDALKEANSSAEELIGLLVGLGYRFEHEEGYEIDPAVEIKKLYANGSMNVVARKR